MKAYPQDLRDRVITAVEAGQHSQPELAATFEVNESTIDKWAKRGRDTGSVAALSFAGGRPRALKACATVIRTEVKQQPDVTLAELCERVAAQTEVTASRSMMARELQVLALSRKKDTVVATLGVNGVQSPLLFEGAMTTLIFETY
jgi:transposase